MKFLQLTLIISLSTTSLLTAQTVKTVDFNVDDAGNPLLEGDGTPGSGLSIGSDTGEVQPYANLFGGGKGITFTDTTNILTLYNTDGTGGLDDDLESTSPPGSFEGGSGNQAGGYGNALIHQTNNSGQPMGSQNNPDFPNDDGNGGILIIFSDIALVRFDFSYIDLDNGNEAGSNLTFLDTASGESASVTFAQLEVGSGSIFSGAGVDFADHHVNDVTSITLSRLQTLNANLTQYDQVTITTAGSGALGEFTIQTIPEPTSAVLIALGASSMVFRRRR